MAIRGHHRRPAYRAAVRHSPPPTPAPESQRTSHPLEQELGQLRQEHDQLRHSLFEAAHVQRKLCGSRHLSRAPYEVASEIFPVQDVSGDFISVFDSRDDLVIAIGDICGKGLAAGMWFTHVVGTIRLQCGTHRNPAVAMAAVNDDLLRSGMDLPLTSLLLCRLSVATGEITYCNAGHPPGLLIDQGGDVESLAEGGPVLGAISGASYCAGSVVMNPGATLLGFSDGVIECGAAAGDEFGVERVLSKARATTGSAVATLFSVLGAVEDFAGHRRREDDLALMVVKRDMNS